MRTEGLTFSIDWKNDIVFKSEYAHIHERDGGLYCSLRGEFFEKDKPYNPPMTYYMDDWSVPTRIIEDVLKDKYTFLVMAYYPEVAKRLFQKT